MSSIKVFRSFSVYLSTKFTHWSLFGRASHNDSNRYWISFSSGEVSILCLMSWITSLQIVHLGWNFPYFLSRHCLVHVVRKLSIKVLISQSLLLSANLVLQLYLMRFRKSLTFKQKFQIWDHLQSNTRQLMYLHDDWWPKEYIVISGVLLFVYKKNNYKTLILSIKFIRYL